MTEPVCGAPANLVARGRIVKARLREDVRAGEFLPNAEVSTKRRHAMRNRSSVPSANRSRLPAVLVGVILAGLLLAFSGTAVAEVLYVSPHGDDGNPGTKTQPLRTLQGARDRVRTMGARGTEEVSVLFKAGDYYITDTVSFGKQDSGANGHPVVYGNWDEKGSANLIGGRTLADWKDEGRGVYSTQLEKVILDRYPVQMAALPAPELRVSYFVEYDNSLVPRQAGHFRITPKRFLRRLAPARTFCFERDVARLQEQGLIRGGTLDCAVVIGEDRILNGPLRFGDEMIRHKVVDLLGDVCLLGRPLRAHVTAWRAGHAWHYAFLKQLKEAVTE